MSIPSGTVTFLFTDIEGSTRLAHGHPETWEGLHLRHQEILHRAIENNNGFVFQIFGDAFCASFHNAVDAMKTAVDLQQCLHNEPWGETVVRVRLGIHSGEFPPIRTIDHHPTMLREAPRRVQALPVFFIRAAPGQVSSLRSSE